MKIQSLKDFIKSPVAITPEAASVLVACCTSQLAYRDDPVVNELPIVQIVKNNASRRGLTITNGAALLIALTCSGNAGSAISMLHAMNLQRLRRDENSGAGLMKIIFGGSMLSMIVKVSAAMSSLVALPFAIVAGLQTLYDKLGWIQDPQAMAQQSGAIKQMTNQALVSGMPMFAQPYFQQQLSQAQNQNGQIIVKLETTSDVDKLIQGHIETNNQKVIQSFVPMGWTSTSN
jgi:hypothetical protein